jgi:hypothetical protein
MTYSQETLRSFGLMLAGFLAAIFGVLFPLLGSKAIPTWPWVCASIILLPSLFKPEILKGIYIPWMKLGSILGWINTRIILSVLFYGLITPIGLILRLFGYNALEPKFDNSATSYFHQVVPRDSNHMEKPF